MRRKTLIVFMVVAGLVAGYPAAAAGTASVSGTVTTNGSALGGIDVYVCSNSIGCATATTDGSGSYTVSGLEAGSYYVEFVDPTKTYASEYYDNQLSNVFLDFIEVSDASTVVGVNADLALGARISGTIVDVSGAPVPANASACDLGVFACYSAQTDSEGNYLIEGIHPGGFYTVHFYSPTGDWVEQWYNGVATEEEADSVPVLAGKITTGIDAVMRRGIEITGSIEDPDHNPIESILVDACPVEGTGECLRSYSESDGTFTIKLANNGPYVLTFEDTINPPRYWSEVYANVSNETDATPIDPNAHGPVHVILSPTTSANHVPEVSRSTLLVSEDLAVGTTILADLASDLDGENLSFKVVGGDPHNLFDVDATGKMTVANRLDFETVPEVTLELEVYDESAVGTGSLTILIKDVVGDNPFTDSDNSVFINDIAWLLDSGITKGCGGTEFCPDDRVTRGQMAAFLNRALNFPATAGDFFTDDSNSVFEADINRLAAAGITKGCSEDSYCPDEPVTRGQMAAFLVRSFEYIDGAGTDRFIDDDDSVFETDIERLAWAGVTLGCNPPENDRFCPDGLVTRGQMAAFLHRAIDG